MSKKILVPLLSVLIILCIYSVAIFTFAYNDYSKAKKEYLNKKETIFSALIQQYKLSLDEQLLMSRGINPENNSKFAEFSMTIQRKNGCFSQGRFFPCANATVFEVLQYKEFLEKEFKIYNEKKYHFETLKSFFVF